MEVNKFNSKKILHSKWTAVAPVRKEKHFIITEVDFLDSGEVESISLEAVLSKRVVQIDWQALKDSGQWQQGWK